MGATQPGSISSLVRENVGLLEQGVEVVCGVAPQVYRPTDRAPLAGGVGRHFRHILDFYDRLIAGYRSIVDYDARDRDPRVETDPEYASEAARRVCRELEELGDSIDAGQGGRPVVVRTEIRSGEGAAVEVESTVERELAVLSSHTIHHYAIISLLLRESGVAVPHGFGVAPSTLRHLALERG